MRTARSLPGVLTALSAVTGVSGALVAGNGGKREDQEQVFHRRNYAGALEHLRDDVEILQDVEKSRESDYGEERLPELLVHWNEQIPKIN